MITNVRPHAGWEPLSLSQDTDSLGEIYKAMYSFSLKKESSGISQVKHFGNSCGEPFLDIFEEANISYKIKDDMLDPSSVVRRRHPTEPARSKPPTRAKYSGCRRR